MVIYRVYEWEEYQQTIHDYHMMKNQYCSRFFVVYEMRVPKFPVPYDHDVNLLLKKVSQFTVSSDCALNCVDWSVY